MLFAKASASQVYSLTAYQHAIPRQLKLSMLALCLVSGLALLSSHPVQAEEVSATEVEDKSISQRLLEAAKAITGSEDKEVTSEEEAQEPETLDTSDADAIVEKAKAEAAESGRANLEDVIKSLEEGKTPEQVAQEREDSAALEEAPVEIDEIDEAEAEKAKIEAIKEAVAEAQKMREQEEAAEENKDEDENEDEDESEAVESIIPEGFEKIERNTDSAEQAAARQAAEIEKIKEEHAQIIQEANTTPSAATPVTTPAPAIEAGSTVVILADKEHVEQELTREKGSLGDEVTGTKEKIDLSDLPLKNVSLNVAFSVTPPFVTLQNSLREPQGLDVDIIRELQRRTGFKLEDNRLEVMNFNEMMELGKFGQVDIAAGAIGVTEARKQIFEMTAPYVANSICIVSRKDNPIRTLADLEGGKTLAVQGGTNINAIVDQFSDIRIYATPSPFMTFYAVSRKHADALLIDEIIADEYLRIMKGINLEVTGVLPDSVSDIAIFLKKGSEHNKYLHQAMDDMRKDGTLEALIKKYIVLEEHDHAH